MRKLIARRKPRRVVVCTIYYLDPNPNPKPKPTPKPNPNPNSNPNPNPNQVCTIYYLDPTPGGSWADFVLNKVGYSDLTYRGIVSLSLDFVRNKVG